MRGAHSQGVQSLYVRGQQGVIVEEVMAKIGNSSFVMTDNSALSRIFLIPIARPEPFVVTLELLDDFSQLLDQALGMEISSQLNHFGLKFGAQLVVF